MKINNSLNETTIESLDLDETIRSKESLIEKMEKFKNKLRFYRNYGDAIFIRFILIAFSIYIALESTCFGHPRVSILIIVLDFIIVIDGIYIILYQKVIN